MKLYRFKYTDGRDKVMGIMRHVKTNQYHYINFEKGIIHPCGFIGIQAALSDAVSNYKVIDIEEIDYVMVPRYEYERCEKARSELATLEAWGVDNWEGYGEAMSEFYRECEDEDE